MSATRSGHSLSKTSGCGSGTGIITFARPVHRSARWYSPSELHDTATAARPAKNAKALFAASLCWSDVAKTFVGSRVRQLRSERGFSQAALAQMLEISPSYLNQIEHDVRPLTVAVLLRITEVFGVDATFFASQDDTRLVAELREVTMDRDLDIDVDPAEIADIVNAHPTLARAMVNLHRRYRITTTQLAAATEDRFSDGSGSGAITMPHEEVRDYFYQRQNYLHELDTAAEDLTIRPAHAPRRPRPRSLRPAQGRARRAHRQAHRPRRHRAAPLRPRDASRLEIGSHLSSGQQVFKMAAELAYLEFGDLIDKLVEEGKFTSEESTTLARLGLANYFAAATVLPYGQFHEVAEKFRYDVERLSAFYSVSYETIAHRLSTLQRPSMRGVPFSFVRVDKAGNMSKRQSATGFHFSSSGGTCPAVERLRDVRQPGQDPGADRADARRPQLHVGGAHRRTPRVAIWSAGQDICDRARLRTSARTPARLLGGTGFVGRHRHTDRGGLPGMRAGQLPAAGVPRARPRARHRRAPQHRVALPGEAAMSARRPRPHPTDGGFRELGPRQLGDRQARRAARIRHPADSACST